MSSDAFRFYSQSTVCKYGHFEITVKTETDSFRMGPNHTIEHVVRKVFEDHPDSPAAIAHEISHTVGVYSVEIIDIRTGCGATHYPNRR